jgi:WD40 repeat protein
VLFTTGLFAALALSIDVAIAQHVQGGYGGPAYAYLSLPLGALAGAAFGWWHVLWMRPRGSKVDGRDLPGPDGRPMRPKLPVQVPLPSGGIVANPRPAPRVTPCEDAAPAHPGAVAGVAISSDGSAVVTCDAYGNVACRDLTTGARYWQYEGPGEARAVALSPDGQLVAACGWNENNQAVVVVLDARTGSALRRLDLNDSASCLAWLPDSRHLLIGCVAAVRVWHIDEETEATSFALPSTYVSWEASSCLAIDANGRTLLVGTAHSNEACVIALPEGEPGVCFDGHKYSPWWPRPAAVRSVALTADGQFAVTGCNGGTARVWSVRTGNEVCQFDGHAGWWGFRGITGVAFLPGGETALSACEDGTLCLWDARTGQELRRWDHGKGIRCLALSADGKIAVTGAWEGSIRVWYLG